MAFCVYSNQYGKITLDVVIGGRVVSIDKIRLKNFTIFKDLSVQLSDGINVFIGQNGTGKTHLLKAVYAACELTQDKENHAKLRDYFRKYLFSLNLFHDIKHTNLEINITNENDKKIKAIHQSNSLLQNNGQEMAIGDCYDIILPDNIIFNSIFMPCKDMITHSKGFLAISEKYRGFPFDKTLTDIIRRANMLPLNTPPELALPIIPYLNKILDGEVDTQDDEFIIKKNDGRTVNFAVEAEGIKKIGLLWRLLMNESITEGSILLWDEPEANLNPEYLPIIVDCLLELSRHNVQILVSTHNYIFAKYFDVKRKESDNVSYHALYIAHMAAECETKNHFTELEHNAIGTAFDKLLDEVYHAGIGD